ncbi:MAG: hypothetical protein WC114_05685 [Smithellaceae bacterium]|jgi:hypothetical protein
MPLKESKIDLTDRLRREGRWAEASAFKDEVIREMRSFGHDRISAKEKGWEEMERLFPPLPPAAEEEDDPAAEEGFEEFPAVDEEAVEAMLDRADKGVSAVDLFGDIRWVYSQLENKRVQPAQAPSAGAWSLLLWARKYQSRFFEQLLPKALAKSPEDDEGVKREKRRVEEIEAMLEKLLEG